MLWPPFLIGDTSSIRVHFPASYVRLPECNQLTNCLTVICLKEKPPLHSPVLHWSSHESSVDAAGKDGCGVFRLPTPKRFATGFSKREKNRDYIYIYIKQRQSRWNKAFEQMGSEVLKICKDVRIYMNYEVRQQFIETLTGECWRERFFKGTFFQILIMLLFTNTKFYQISPLFAACSSPATLKMICRGRDSWNQHGAGMTRGAPIESVQKTAKQRSG